MCGRYTYRLTWSELVALYRLTAPVGPPSNLEPRYNVAPTQTAPVVRVNVAGGRELAMLRWGLIPFWAKDAKIGRQCINARADGVASKPAFRAAFKQRRCLVPVSGFYEWQARGKAPKQPYLIEPAEGDVMTFAGLWERWAGNDDTPGPVETFAIITTDASATLAPIHNRMPVILAPADFDAWLDTDNRNAAALLKPAPAGAVHTRPVSTRVNNVRNDDPDLIAPLAA